jgi:hypothetical protein
MRPQYSQNDWPYPLGHDGQFSLCPMIGNMAKGAKEVADGMGKGKNRKKPKEKCQNLWLWKLFLVD